MQTLSRGSLRGCAGHSIILRDFVPDFFVKFVFLQQPHCSQYTRAAKHALRQTQTSRTKACSQVHMIQVHMTSSSLCYFVFGEIPTLNSLPLSISGQDLYRRERTAWRSNVGKIITEDVMLLAAIIVRRHLTSTLYVLVCINPVLRWTAEGNSGLGFHQKQSSID